MDFNAIENRLQRIYDSINATYSDDKESHTKMEVNESILSITFERGTETENQVRIFAIIHNIANLKDNLKNKLKELGLDSGLVEKEIDNSLYLQLIADLSNQDKHGYPLTKTRRSGKDPLIENISTRLIMSSKEDGSDTASMSFKLDGTGVPIFEGNNKISVSADIVDASKNYICSFIIMVENAIKQWELFLKMHEII